jgi:hypothetical protein
MNYLHPQIQFCNNKNLFNASIQIAIRAELIGSDRCSGLGMTARGTTPVLALCRLLIEAGNDLATPLEAWRGDVLCLRIRSIGEGARLTGAAGRGSGTGEIGQKGVAQPRQFAKSGIHAMSAQHCECSRGAGKRSRASLTPEHLAHYNCSDCGINVVDIGEFYMVHPRIWHDELGLGWDDNLCIGCLEARLGREVRGFADFISFPDYPWMKPSSDRLLNRICGLVRDSEGDLRFPNGSKTRYGNWQTVTKRRRSKKRKAAE